MSKLKATVFIPTYNGERYLPDIFKALLKQEVPFEYEILVIDSGSSDTTLKIIRSAMKKNSRIRLHEIPNTEYGHGKTRNFAAHMAKGEIVVYLSHDAIPAHDGWLYEMVKPFDINERIAGVMGKQIPRHNCIPLLKYEINSVFGNFGPDFGTTIFYKDSFVKDQSTYDAISFYSDVNSAARRSLIVSDLPYQDVPYAEDQLFGRDVIDNGYYKAYAARGSVVHSNDLTLGEYRHRLFDETLGLRRIGIPVAVPSRRTIAKIVTRGIAKDTLRILIDRDYTWRRKLYWLVLNPVFYVRKWQGVRQAALTDLSDNESVEKYSLEKRRNKRS